MAHVLIVDDEPNMRKVLGALLENAGHATSRASSGEEALALVRSQDPDVVLTDLRMEGLDGMQLLERLRADFPEIPVVLLTAHGSIDVAVEAMKRGAFDFVEKPFDQSRVLEIVAKAAGQATTLRDDVLPSVAARAPLGMVGSSSAMQALRKLIERVAPSPTTVLVTGETGTGKELVAEALHRLSPRMAGPLVRINCGALPENLVESELFGHERGAFSGADRRKPGRFELADGGTLFLDEVGELPLELQPMLLRALEQREIRRVGDEKPRKVNVRVLAATNRDLDAEVAKGRFRADLLHRLAVVRIRLPPLRERLVDLPMLTRSILDGLGARAHGFSLSPALLEQLAARPWPGNVRELRNLVERAVALGDPSVAGDAAGETETKKPIDYQQARDAALASFERDFVQHLLRTFDGNVSKAAREAKVDRVYLHKLIKRHRVTV
jgi:DNA-binding NtrC family response regulator